MCCYTLPSVCVSLMTGSSAGHDREHPVWQLRPQDQLHNRCVWDENRWTEEGKMELWPLSALIISLMNPEPLKKPGLCSNTTNGTHEGFAHYLSKWWNLAKCTFKCCPYVRVCHNLALNSIWMLLRAVSDCVKEEKLFLTSLLPHLIESQGFFPSWGWR